MLKIIIRLSVAICILAFASIGQAQVYDEDSLNQLISRLECEGKLSSAVKENAKLSKQIQDFKVIAIDLTIHQDVPNTPAKVNGKKPVIHKIVKRK